MTAATLIRPAVDECPEVEPAQQVPCSARFGTCCYTHGEPCPRPADVRVLLADDRCTDTQTLAFCADCWAVLGAQFDAGIYGHGCGGTDYVVVVEPVR